LISPVTNRPAAPLLRPYPSETPGATRKLRSTKRSSPGRPRGTRVHKGRNGKPRPPAGGTGGGTGRGPTVGTGGERQSSGPPTRRAAANGGNQHGERPAPRVEVHRPPGGNATPADADASKPTSCWPRARRRQTGLRELYERNHARILRFCRGRLGDCRRTPTTDAQETFLRAWRARANRRRRGQLLSLAAQHRPANVARSPPQEGPYGREHPHSRDWSALPRPHPATSASTRPIVPVILTALGPQSRPEPRGAPPPRVAGGPRAPRHRGADRHERGGSRFVGGALQALRREFLLQDVPTAKPSSGGHPRPADSHSVRHAPGDPPHHRTRAIHTAVELPRRPPRPVRRAAAAGARRQDRPGGLPPESWSGAVDRLQSP